MINIEVYLLFWFDFTAQGRRPQHRAMTCRDVGGAEWLDVAGTSINFGVMDAHKAFCSWIHSHVWEFMVWMSWQPCGRAGSHLPTSAWHHSQGSYR